ncbi:hypothetical protein SteCoe_33720 [Stentor coeruleus]|uniref:Uncharacterized protein n=1 Tax=Stentor coeruleus TaxID=5963 RepID=A0A1R2AWC5_9CILI|nr:hypothetical protein SteCoe_33720 [Stentor coeruleus]
MFRLSICRILLNAAQINFRTAHHLKLGLSFLLITVYVSRSSTFRLFRRSLLFLGASPEKALKERNYNSAHILYSLVR